MKEILIFISLVSAVMTLTILILFIRGIIILITGECKLRQNLVTGKNARTIGLIFVIVPICVFVLWAILYENFNWGSSRNESAIFIDPIVQSSLFIIGSIGAYSWSLSRAKNSQKGKEKQ